MDRQNQTPRPPTRRRPLGDATLRANIGPTTARDTKQAATSSSSGPLLPHNESIIPNGTLSVRNGSETPENKRSSAVCGHQGIQFQRNSAISTASTNASGKRDLRKSLIGPWQLGMTIGIGGCSSVREVRHIYNFEIKGAAKIISKANAERIRALSLANLIESAENENQSLSGTGKHIPFGLDREITIMKLLEHPNIVRLYDVWESRNQLYVSSCPVLMRILN
jgi:serine/threonine-protein kinase HSL1, negative regulator of Swe1 kinase